MLDLKRLKVLVEVDRCGSFSSAADAMNYSQPAISNNINRLELEVGAQLIDRRGRAGIQLTEAGRALLSHAQALLDRMADAEGELSELIGSTRRTVRLGAFATASATIVAGAIARLRADDTVSFTLIEGEAPESLDRLKSRQIDLALVFDDERHPLVDDAVELHYLRRDPMLLAVPARHRLAKQPEIDIADLAGDSWIEGARHESPCSLILDQLCEEAGFDPGISFNSGDYQVVLSLVASGVGVALVPELAVSGSSVGAGVALRPLRGSEAARRIAIATLPDRLQSPATQRVFGELQRACARLPWREAVTI